MARGDITNYAASLAPVTAINFQPGVGVKQQIIGIHCSETNTDAGTASSTTNMIFMMFNGTTRGHLGRSTYPSSSTQEQFHKGGAIINNTNYLRLYNGHATETLYYNIVLMEI